MLKWPGFLGRLMKNALPPTLEFYKYDGTMIVKLGDRDVGREGIISAPLWRNTLHSELYQYAIELGIPIEFNVNATEFYESSSKGFVRAKDGRIYEADLVIAADGLSSRSEKLIAKEYEAPTSSEYAIYRTSFPLDHALKNPDVAAFWGSEDFQGVRIFLADDLHIVTAKSTKTNRITWMMTHKDVNKSASEAWSADCPASDALAFVPESAGWPGYIRGLIKQTPNNRCVNWSLMWRSPREDWVSPKGRVVQVGDACHPFIPTSGSGAVMAMEDGYSLAACLQIAGKDKIPLAVKVHNKLRFERVSFAQKMGFDTREFYHHPNWDNMMKHPEALGVVRPWILEHDAEKYAIDNFAACAKHIIEGAPFENNNGPPGEKYVPWKISELLETAERNRQKQFTKL
ncbi:hypothetical protein, variant [Verruconis gallopava]|nr:hypothetical protein, variant [Verruconis gallopava]KIV98920.1 hypothetical protein, variant [Verruconis gallopava]